MNPLLRPLHLAAVHEAGAGEVEGRVREENHHKNIYGRPPGEEFWNVHAFQQLIIDNYVLFR